jgi:hypothetical protein
MSHVQTLSLQPITSLIDQIKHGSNDQGNTQGTESNITQAELLRSCPDIADTIRVVRFPFFPGNSVCTINLGVRMKGIPCKPERYNTW